MLYNRRYVENSNAPTRHRTLRSGQRRPPSPWEFCKRRVLENFTSSAHKKHLPRQSLVGPALARLNAPFSHEPRLFQGYIPASERRLTRRDHRGQTFPFLRTATRRDRCTGSTRSGVLRQFLFVVSLHS